MRITKIIAVSLALGATLPACDPGPADAADDLSSYEGDDLFRGLVLGYGPVADLVPEVRDQLAIDNYIADEQQRAELEAGLDELVDEMAITEPEFFPRFELDLRSGDPKRIEAAIADGKALANRVVPRIAQLQTPGSDSETSVAQTIALLYPGPTPILHTWVIVELNRYFPPYLFITQSTAAAADQALVHEQLVQRIATAACRPS